MAIDQCAQFLQVTVGTIYVCISQRKIPVRKLGSHRNAAVRFDLDEIVEWTKGNNDRFRET
jgi:excisionase family DNA binding protein